MKIGRDRHDADQRIEDVEIVEQQRENLHPGGQSREKPFKRKESFVGLAGLRQSLQQGRHQLGEQPAGAFGAGRAQAALVPMHDRGADFRAALEPKLVEGFNSCGMRLDAGEHHRPETRFGNIGGFKQPVIALADTFKSRQQFFAEGVRVLRAGKNRHPFDVFRGLRHTVGLLVIHHLQAMLDMAQIAIGGAHLIAVRLRDGARRRQGRQRIQRRI